MSGRIWVPYDRTMYNGHGSDASRHQIMSRVDVAPSFVIQCRWVDGGILILIGWSLLSHGVAEGKRLNLGNLNPVYERVLTRLDVHQEEGRWNVFKDGLLFV